MKFKGRVYAPPVEGATRIIQASYGCSHNACSFCNMYLGENFQLMDKDFISSQLEHIRDNWASKVPVTRLYIADGDPFALSTRRLLAIFDLARVYLPDVEEFSMYASVRNIMDKTDEDLRLLKDQGLDELYIGYESGHEDFHKALNTGNSLEESYEAGLRLKKAGIKQDMFLMLGTGGKGTYEEAALASARLANEICPERISVNTTTVREGIALYDKVVRGDFEIVPEREAVLEERILVENLTCQGTDFWGRHPNNAVSTQGYLQGEKDKILQDLDWALENKDWASFERNFPRLRTKENPSHQ